MTAPRAVRTPLAAAGWLWTGPIAFVAVLSLYWTGRFEGYWAESDSATFARHIRDVVDTGQLIPGTENVYPNGYLYQAVSTFLAALGAVDVGTLQQRVYPLLAVLIAPVAWLTYRALTRSTLWAALCTVLLFTQPDFLFVVMRSSHEKFTRLLMLLCIYLLVRTLDRGASARKFAVYTILLYGAAYALIASNYLLGMSFIVALAVAQAVGWLLGRVKANLAGPAGLLSRRLPYAIVGFVVVAYVFMFYAYPPARHNLLVGRQTWDLITALFTEEQAAEQFLGAYGAVTLGWINLQTYLILSIANWVVLIASSLLWLRRAWSWVIRSEVPGRQTHWFLWLLYTAFVAQGFAALVADASGALAGNMQLRLFPSLSMIAVAFIAAELAWRRPRLRLPRRAALVASATIFLVSILAVVKATNEPLFSNKWNFYRSAELIALEWTDEHLRHADIWVEFDERLTTAYRTAVGEIENSFVTSITPNTRTVVVSDVTRLRSTRIRETIPVPPGAQQIYDNGGTQVYHLTPTTPYQR